MKVTKVGVKKKKTEVKKVGVKEKKVGVKKWSEQTQEDMNTNS